MTEKKKSIWDDFTLITILLIPIGIAVNVIGNTLAVILGLPMYLDTIGTIFIGIIAGPWVGAITGLLTNIVAGFLDSAKFWFIHVNVIVGLITGFMARAGWFTDWRKAIVAILVQSVASTIASAPPIVYVFEGVTGSGTSLISEVMIAAGKNIWASFLSVEIIWTVVDRIISWLISLGVISIIPDRTLVKFPLGNLYLKNK